MNIQNLRAIKSSSQSRYGRYMVPTPLHALLSFFFFFFLSRNRNTTFVQVVRKSIYMYTHIKQVKLDDRKVSHVRDGRQKWLDRSVAGLCRHGPGMSGSLYMALLDSTQLYQGSTWLYVTQLHTTTALLDTTWLYCTLLRLYLALLDSTRLYYTLPLLYLAVLSGVGTVAAVSGFGRYTFYAVN